VLTVTNGAFHASITLFGQYAAAGFRASADGAGMAITYMKPVAATHPDLAVPHT